MAKKTELTPTELKKRLNESRSRHDEEIEDLPLSDDDLEAVKGAGLIGGVKGISHSEKSSIRSTRLQAPRISNNLEGFAPEKLKD